MYDQEKIDEERYYKANKVLNSIKEKLKKNYQYQKNNYYENFEKGMLQGDVLNYETMKIILKAKLDRDKLERAELEKEEALNLEKIRMNIILKEKFETDRIRKEKYEEFLKLNKTNVEETKETKETKETTDTAVDNDFIKIFLDDNTIFKNKLVKMRKIRDKLSELIDLIEDANII